MARPYNKKTIDDAVLLCQMIADNPHSADDMDWYAIFLGIRPTSTALELAHQARTACEKLLVGDDVLAHLTPGFMQEVWAEAAALIAEGWQIGDDVAFIQRVQVIADENVPEGMAYLVQKIQENGSQPDSLPIQNERVLKLVYDVESPEQHASAELAKRFTPEEAEEMRAAQNKAVGDFYAVANASTTAIEIETPVESTGGANVMDENGLEPAYNYPEEPVDGDE